MDKMARRTIAMIEVEEVIYRWLKGMSMRKIAASLGISRNTVKSLILQAQQAGLTVGSSIEEMENLRSSLLGLRSQKRKDIGTAQHYLSGQHLQIEAWQQMPHMTVTQMVRLFGEKGQRVSETSLRRYIKKHFPSLPASTVHLETVAGRQAQVDFGYVGMMAEPVTQKFCKAYAFIMTLSHSRHRFVRFVFRQDIGVVLDKLR
jgi:hypothetical protein